MSTSARIAYVLILATAHQLPAAESVYRRVLPGVVNTRGADGARIETTTWLVNLGSTAGSFEFTFVSKLSGGPAAQSRTLGPGETLRLNNAIEELFGLAEGEGALVVRGDQPFGLRGVKNNSAFVSTELLGTDTSAHSILLTNETDITAVLTAPNTAVTVSVYDAGGVLRGIEVVTSEEPTIWRASTAQFLPDADIPAGRVKFAVTAGEATGFLAGKGFIAQPERIPVTSPEGTSLLLNGVTASTELRLFNPNDSELEIVIEALGFAGGPATIIRRATVGPNGLAEIPGAASLESATGALRMRASLPFLAAGRGVPMAVAYETGFATPSQSATLVGLSEGVGRISLFSGARGASGVLRLRNASGTPIAASQIRLEANEWQGRATSAWFPDAQIPADARVDIELESGSAHGYAEIADVVVAPAVVPVTVPSIPTARRLVFSSLPSSIIAGEPFSTTVQAIRADNSIDTRFNGSIELRVASGPGGFQGPATASQAAVGGIAFFQDLRLTAPGSYTFGAVGTGLEPAVSQPLVAAPVQPPPAMIVRTGTFAGQNGYTAEGTLQIERAANGSETLRLNPNFRVSSGAGSISVWLARSSGALNMSSSLRVGTITRVYAGEFTFPIPSPGSNGFTHVIVFCDPFRINFGAAQLRNP